MLGVDATALLAPLRGEPSRSAILSDLDGTLAPIVTDPQDATVPEEAREVLSRLCERYALVALVTGRRALEARRMVGVGGAVYAGNHGLELIDPGADEPVVADELAERAELARELVSGLDDHELSEASLRVEDKGPIQAIHWRGAPEAERARRAAEEIASAAARQGLFPHWGRQVLELRPTEAVDKGSAVRALIAGRDVDLAFFGGDDRTDLDAFDALGEMATAGELRAAVRVGVSSEEAPEGLRDRSDIVVQGTAGFLEVLRALAEDD